MPLRSGVFTGCAQPNRSNDNAPSLGRCAPGRDFHQDGPTLLLQAPSERFFPQPRHGARSSAPSSSDSTLSGLPGRQAPGSNKTDDFLSYQPRSSNASSPRQQMLLPLRRHRHTLRTTTTSLSSSTLSFGFHETSSLPSSCSRSLRHNCTLQRNVFFLYLLFSPSAPLLFLLCESNCLLAIFPF